jgi:hypothetical protein
MMCISTEGRNPKIAATNGNRKHNDSSSLSRLLQTPDCMFCVFLPQLDLEAI